ncbi:similar to plasmid transfer protein (plasmid) [Erwinia billingiae Eb661]|uniref:Similar to plasmid transfer protein n=1 Tax=Erwinia billingiae (strain Eb661) TaxID=634500 RepID=D8MJC3_ERWBE|nr:similar to plasmid transfer protein [Erwinia billingiae Eb661]
MSRRLVLPESPAMPVRKLYRNQIECHQTGLNVNYSGPPGLLNCLFHRPCVSKGGSYQTLNQPAFRVKYHH